MALAVANRYAGALAGIALDPGSKLEPAAALEQLRSFAALLHESPDLRNVLLSPAVPAARKRNVVAALGEPLHLHPLLRNFLYVVIDHRRIDILDEMAAALETVLDQRLGRLRADVSSAGELTASEKLMIEGELRRKTGKQVRCDFHIDPELLGGVSVRVGSTIYDGSVRGQLAAVRARLMAH
ncbi:MAG: ATP synthase F1 subunit delta [Bryobacteraceae bacterium]